MGSKNVKTMEDITNFKDFGVDPTHLKLLKVNEVTWALVGLTLGLLCHYHTDTGKHHQCPLMSNVITSINPPLTLENSDLVDKVAIIVFDHP